MSTTRVSTHVLDAATGTPAAGLTVALTGPDGAVLGSGATDDDGRVGSLFEGAVEPGPHRLTFATGHWFATQGRETFFPEVVVVVDLAPEREHYHVPVLLSPYSYTAYRGS